MSYDVKILLDSIAPSGIRLTTWELIYPRFVHSELMTHRVFSRNSASSRAIPAVTLRKRIIDDPVLPVFWGANQKGMQASSEVADVEAAKEWWLRGRDLMSKHHEEGEKLGVHKQLLNRVVEPWMFITILLTATEFDNWFRLRDHKDAQPEIAWVARRMRELYAQSRPHQLRVGEWHLPLLRYDDVTEAQKRYPLGDDCSPGTVVANEQAIDRLLCKVSTGHCARISYLTHDGRRDLNEDVGLHDRLTGNGHWSPFEHPAQALEKPDWCGNIRGWKQYRAFVDPHFQHRVCDRCRQET